MLVNAAKLTAQSIIIMSTALREGEASKRQRVAEDSGSDEDDPPEIRLDQHGRIVGAHGSINYDFQCFQSLFDGSSWSTAALDALKRDCRIAFTAQEIDEDEDYSEGETFFVSASATPETDIERLVLSVFRKHTENVTYDHAKSGAEWWTLVVPADGGGVGFHWDKDYALEEYGVNVFPHLATVTYVDEGAGAASSPTIAFQKTAPPMYGSSFAGSAGSQALVSFPENGKHIIFDGRFLHAAVSDLAKGGVGVSAERITLLINVWLDHMPVDVDPIEDAAGRLSRGIYGSAVPNFSRPREPAKLLVADCKSKQTHTWPLTVGETSSKITATTPANIAELREESTIRLIFEEDALPRVTNGQSSP